MTTIIITSKSEEDVPNSLPLNKTIYEGINTCSTDTHNNESSY